MREATEREIKTLRNFLGEYTTGILRKELVINQYSSTRVRSIVDNGWINKGTITKIVNIICKTNALETVKNTCLWY